MSAAFLTVEPRLFLHGHYHLADEEWVDQFAHPTHVVSVDCHSASEGNLVLVALPERESRQEPAVKWLSLPADQHRDLFADDPITLKASVRTDT